MIIDYYGDTFATCCTNCGSLIEIVELLCKGDSLYCPHCYTDGDSLSGLCGYVGDLVEAGLSREHVIKVR